MILPAAIPALNERPPARRTKRLTVPLREFIHQLTGRAARDQQHLMNVMNQTSALVRNDGDRDALEGLLGKPAYALDGSLYSEHSADGQTLFVPRVVEVYRCRRNVVVELWFGEANERRITGYVSLWM